MEQLSHNDLRVSPLCIQKMLHVGGAVMDLIMNRIHIRIACGTLIFTSNNKYCAVDRFMLSVAIPALNEGDKVM